MQLKNQFHLGKVGSSFFVWDEKNHFPLSARNLTEAKKEGLQKIEEYEKRNRTEQNRKNNH